MFGRPTSEWIAEYSLSHTNPVNRACHTVGIPMIAVSVALALLLPLTLLVPALRVAFGPLWMSSVGLFVVGWIFQFIGHGFEGKPPEIFKDWRFAFVGLRWWFAKVSGRA